ncbi:hypothetical protein DM02DRAFT_627521 [Periconia macrospinosa]|uniref:Rhodopsin domain-containing protein n=1 Tax=Periconia macrospinosa TaxID=97972 RepID=A0A2V1DTZ8_9PLEO|nr:hypothetical protein DM02DRAFT_627521 [Periconia macrospinosa]
MGISLCYLISVLLETFLLCKPVAFNWDKTIPTGTCDKNSNIAYTLAGTINVVIDIIVVIMPMPMLWQLHMPFTKKVGVIAMFSLGGGICIISILRVIYVAKMDLTDFAYASVDLSIWSVLEPTLGIVNACLPVLRPIIARLMNSPAFVWARTTVWGSTKSASQGTELTFDKNRKSGWKGMLSSNKPDAKDFKKIRDPYALDTVNLVGNDPRDDIELSNHSGIGTETYGGGIVHGNKKPDGDIRVTTDWTIDVEQRSRQG